MKLSPAFILKYVYGRAIQIDVYIGKIVIANHPAGI